MKKQLIILSLFISLMLAGCSSSEEIKEETKNTEEVAIVDITDKDIATREKTNTQADEDTRENKDMNEEMDTNISKDEENEKNEDTEKDEDEDTKKDTINTDPKPVLKEQHIFKSSRGYSIIFPSTNISFKGVDIKNSPDIDGVSGCYWAMNVAKFSTGDMVETKPAITMYNCSKISPDISDFGKYIRKNNNEGKNNFLIEVINEEWKEFAENIEIK